jgi:hypothetical protein
MTINQKIAGYKRLIKQNREHAGHCAMGLERLYKSRLRYWQRKLREVTKP